MSHEHDRGLDYDLPRLITRRRAVGVLFGGAGAALLAACGGSSSTSSAPTAAAGGGGEIPEETAGPYPGDGSNGPNVLSESGVVRQDITKSFGDASGVAEGVPTTVSLTLLDVAGGGQPLAGAASTRGTATPPGATRSMTRRSRARTTCAACRSPAPTAR